MSLVEVVVALAIIGVMAGAAVLSVGAFDRSAAPDTEARLLAARINLAADTTLLEGRTLVLDWDERSYDVGYLNPSDGKQKASFIGGRKDLPPSLQLMGPRPVGALPIMEAGGAEPTAFIVRGRTSDWRVVFDGLAATASPATAP